MTGFEPLASSAIVYGAQILVVVGVAALAEGACRLVDPRVRLIYWRAVGMVCLVLPAFAWAFPASSSSASAVVTGSISGLDVVPAEPGFPYWSLIVVTVLVAGMLLRTGWLLLGARRLRRIRRSSTRAALDSDIEALRAALAPWAEFRWSNEVGQPVTFGARDPVILLPPPFDDMSPDERRAVACHELLHVARRDWSWIVLEENLRSVFWFHPAVWWLVEQIQVSREQMIDRLVVSRLGSKRAYMSALIAFADGTAHSPSTAFLRRRHLKVRLRLLSREVAMSPKRLAWTAAVLTFVVAGATAGIARALPLQIPTPAAQATSAPRLEIRLAEDSPGFGLTDATISSSNRSIYLHPTALVTNADVVNAEVVESGGSPSQFGVAVTFNGTAAGRVTAATRAHIGKPLAILVNGQVVAALVVRDAIGGRAVISGNFTAQQARALADGLASSGRQAAVVQRPGAGIVMPTLLTQTRPEYTQAAMAERIEGTVVMTAVVRADGTVDDVTVTRSLDQQFGLDDQAVAAARQWTFRPGTRNGEPVPVQVVIETAFTLRK